MGDDEAWVYIKGQQVGYGGPSWPTSATVIIPRTANVLAAKIYDWNSYGWFLGSFSDGIVTDNSWKCTTRYSVGWNTPTFDDSVWPAAVSTVKNGLMVLGIASNAELIWIGPYGTCCQLTVYCRKKLGKI